MPLDTPEPVPGMAAALPSMSSARRCENCGEPLYGEFCSACGQPLKGLVRHFSSVIGDFFDTAFNIDSRVLRTIGPLLFKPGLLSLEYFAGRRVRYVTPMRLFLSLSLLAFLAMQGSIESNEQGSLFKDDAQGDAIDRAVTVEQVRSLTNSSLAKLEQARRRAGNAPAAGVGIEIARQQLREHAQRQIAYLKAVEQARAVGKPAPAAPMASDHDNMTFPINGKPWDPASNPISLPWLPKPLNGLLNRRLKHARDVLKASGNQKPLIDALFNVLPQTLIVLMPVFALMLKIAYWFKRRLYMEHLIVALHSHSFFSLALTVVLAFRWIQESLAAQSGFFNGLLGWAIGLTSAWIPVYVLLMQKRVYGQGWVMTLLKYFVLGLCYVVLLSLALVAAMLVGLLTM